MDTETKPKSTRGRKAGGHNRKPAKGRGKCMYIPIEHVETVKMFLKSLTKKGDRHEHGKE